MSVLLRFKELFYKKHVVCLPEILVCIGFGQYQVKQKMHCNSNAFFNIKNK